MAAPTRLMNGGEHGRTATADGTSLTTGTEAIRELRGRLVGFVGRVVEDAGADRAVLTLDGGVASATLATLATTALDPDRVVALVLPAHLSNEATAREAMALATALGIEHHRLHLRPLLAAFHETMDGIGVPVDDLVATQNALMRVRMICAYYVANTRNGVVLGSATRTERLLGSVTKHGDTGVDALPLGGLYHTEVCALATELGVPESATTGSRDGFGVLDTDAERLGIDDRTLDELLVAVVDAEQSPATVAERVGVDRETVERIEAWRAATAHKRRQPRTPGER